MSSASGLRPDQYEFLVPRAGCIAPRPKTIAETGLGVTFLGDLLEKHLFEAGVLSGMILSCLILLVEAVYIWVPFR
jgi:hypothetical protein